MSAPSLRGIEYLWPVRPFLNIQLFSIASFSSDNTIPAVRIALALSFVRKDSRINCHPMVGTSFLGTRF
jgi:hypothetical protein